jgi:glycerophosphoryl diester phosphodiesterase
MSYQTDTHFLTLDQQRPSQSDYELAGRAAPRIRFDVSEPFLPAVVGYTVFHESAVSPSFPRKITLAPGTVTAIEYAIWWDWDIEHLYELEHIWIYLDASEQVVTAEASWHGGFHPMRRPDGSLPPESDRITLFSEPGKHAFAPVSDWLMERAPTTTYACGAGAGRAGVHVTPLFEDTIHSRTPLNNQHVHTYLERLAFKPAYRFDRIFNLEKAVFVPWDNLRRWIPGRVDWWTQQLAHTIPPHERRVLRIAHRGASAYAQESSPSAVRHAAESGADMIEIDIRLTADHIPVVTHDASLQRVFGLDHAVAELTADQLRSLTPPGFEPVLTFAEMAELCHSLHLNLYLDIKEITPPAFEAIITELKRYGMLRYAIFGSFRPDFLAEIKASTPQAATSVLFSTIHIDPVTLAQAVCADFVHPCWERFDQPHTLLTPGWLARVHTAGLGVVCWHEERPAVISRLHQLGVQAICSDMPDLLIPENR